MKKVYLITGNEEKVEAAAKAFAGTDIVLKLLDRKHPEIQSDNSTEIAEFAVRRALEDVESPVIREDHSLYLDAIPGFPGPYLSYFDENLPAEKLIEILEGKKRTGHFEICTVLGLPDGRLKRYKHKVPLRVSEEARGDRGNWDRVMMLMGAKRTFAETDPAERIDTWNSNFRDIAEFLSEERM